MSNRHKRNVQKRIIATIITLIILTAAGFGIVAGASYLVNNTGLFRAKDSEEASEETTEASEPVSEADDSWAVVASKDEISDNYADVDVSVLSENEVSDEEVSENEVSENEVSENNAEYDAEIESIIDSMALEEKVAQLFIVTPESITGVDVVTQAGNQTKDALSEYPVGGIIYSAANFEDPDQTREMLSNTSSYIKEFCSIEPFLAVDEEGGSVTRIASNSAFGVKDVGPMADIKDENAAHEAGSTIGSYLHDLGFNLDMAPVADVLTNKDNTVIGDRSFGSDPEKVGSCSVEFAKGLMEEGVTPCFKHFPGHGSTGGDTHEESVVLEKSYDELASSDLLPFIRAINMGMPVIMASHISCKEITDSELPTSLSPYMLTTILREQLGFDGVIITDSFSMKAITDLYPDSGKAAVSAIKAGADVILMPADFHEAYNQVLSAASSGEEIDEERINDSLRRILKVKLGRYSLKEDTSAP